MVGISGGTRRGSFNSALLRDWLSRPPKDVPRVFRGKPVAVAGASPGGFGTVLSQNAWLPVFRTLFLERFAAFVRKG